MIKVMSDSDKYSEDKSVRVTQGRSAAVSQVVWEGLLQDVTSFAWAKP